MLFESDNILMLIFMILCIFLILRILKDIK